MDDCTQLSSTLSTLLDPTQSTESLCAKSIQNKRANLAVAHLWETLLEETQLCCLAQESDIPQTPEEALGGPEAKEWKAAMDKEHVTLMGMGTWKKGMLPEGRKVVGCRWVFTKKRDEHGKVIKFKARLVVQGFSQKPGVDYSEDATFAPVMRFETLCTLLAFSTVHNLKLRQFDIKGAYLHGKLDEEIYMAQPPFYNDGTENVCILLQSLYGLKQAGNVWNQELT